MSLKDRPDDAPAGAANCRCGRRETMGLASTECRWPSGTIVTWYLDISQLPKALPDSGVVGLSVSDGIEPWPTHCGVTCLRVADPSLARVFIKFREIDGPYNVLGLTELPCSGSAEVQHTMILDTREQWTPTWLAQVTMHEFGHGLGLNHAPAGQAVMSPVYNPALKDLQTWDIAEARRRYGPPASTSPTPTPSPSPSPPWPDPTPPAPTATPSDFADRLIIAAPGPTTLQIPPLTVTFGSAGVYAIRITIGPAGPAG